MNGDFAAPPASLSQGPAASRLLDRKRSAVERLTPLFHAMLARAPSQDEAEPLIALVDGETMGPDAAIGRLYWALANSTEFHTNR
jgi:hypothetical protein